MLKFGHVVRVGAPGTREARQDLLAPLGAPAHAESWLLGSVFLPCGMG